MPRFVILSHDHPHQHWDLMLEMGPMLRTWRLPQILQENTPLEIEQTFDHRPQYLDYQGPVSQGRGSVCRWDGGTYELIAEDASTMHVLLNGTQTIGLLQLDRRKDQLWLALLQPLP